MRRKAKREALENKLAGDLTALGCPTPVREYMFAKSIGRRWRFDFCWIDQKLAVEADGGTWSGGRHVRGSGYAKDTEKLNQAATMGYRVLRYTSDKIKSGQAAREIAAVLMCYTGEDD
jgi:very-short-patch-repair endonuclease